MIDRDEWMAANCGDWPAPCNHDPAHVAPVLRADECGGCAGLGSHKRWCEAVVGRHAHMLGKWSEQAESLGDSVGPNEMGASNHLWAAAGLLRIAARERADEWRARENSEGYAG